MSQLYTRSFAIAVMSQTGFVMANLLMAHYSRWIAFLGGGVEEVGWIMGVGSLGTLLLRPWLAQWLNRLGALRMWAVGYGLFVLGTLGNLGIYDLGWVICILRISQMLGAAGVLASSLTYVSQTAPADRQTEAIGILGVGGFIGFILGPFLGDLILGTGDRTRHDFLLLFLTTAGALVVPAILLCFLRLKVAPKSAGVSLGDFVRSVIRYWPGIILAVKFVFGVCMTIPLIFLAKYIDEQKLVIPGVSVVGLFFFCYALMGLVMRIGFRRVPDRFGRRKVLLVGMAVMACGMFSFLLVGTEHPWLLVVPGLLCGTGHGLMFHTATTLVLQSFPPEVRGTGSTLSFMMLDLGSMMGAPILGTIAGEYGYPWLFISVGCCCLGVGAGYFCILLGPYLR